jgi:transposase
MLTAADLPDDVAAPITMLLAARAEDLRKEELIARLARLIAAFKQAAFGRRSEKTDPDRFELSLEDLETAIAAVKAEDEATPSPTRPRKPRAANRGALPAHLPRIEELVEPTVQRTVGRDERAKRRAGAPPICCGPSSTR